MASRVTIAQLSAEIADLRAQLALAVPTPATTRAKASAKKATRKPARKVTPKVASKPAAKGSQTRAALSRKDWNRTLTAKARLAGKNHAGVSVYSLVMGSWADVQAMRDAGVTPDQALARIAG